VFDETNGSQVEQYDLDIIDDKEAYYNALRTMIIGDVIPQKLNEDQPSSNATTPLTQTHDQPF
jgi:hypothetical protein